MRMLFKLRGGAGPHPAGGDGWRKSIVQGTLFATSLVALIAPATAQEPDSLATAFHARLEQLRREDGFPGATAAFLLADGRGAEVAVGFADMEGQIGMRPDHRMLAASIGKTFVAATVISLDRENRLDLDDPLSRWLGDEPWFQRLPNADDITLRSLLNHTSGLPSHVGRAFIEDWSKRIREDPEYAPTPQDAIAYVLDQTALFGVGEGMDYSETGYLLLGLVIERACGCRYYDLLRVRFLEPLSLKRTDPADGPELADVAVGYLGADDYHGLPRKTLIGGRIVPNPAFEFTGGGIVSTSGDLARWAQALYGGKAMESPYLQELLTGVPSDPRGTGFWYGLGTYIYPTRDCGIAYGHGGSTANYRSQLLYYPESGLAVAVQVNQWRGVPAGRYASELARVVIDALSND